jgi:hypothetical protein
MMLPVRDASTALRTVLSVLIWMLNPFSGSEPAICTWTISWLPWDAKRTGGDVGHVVAVVEVRQTTPVRACALGIAAGRTGSIDRISRGIMTSSFGFFNLILHRFSIGGYSRSLNIRVSSLRDRSVAAKRSGLTEDSKVVCKYTPDPPEKIAIRPALSAGSERSWKLVPETGYEGQLDLAYDSEVLGRYTGVYDVDDAVVVDIG